MQNEPRFRFIKNLRGAPEVVIAAIEATDEQPRFLDTPIFAALVRERGNPLPNV